MIIEGRNNKIVSTSRENGFPQNEASFCSIFIAMDIVEFQKKFDTKSKIWYRINGKSPLFRFSIVIITKAPKTSGAFYTLPPRRNVLGEQPYFFLKLFEK